MSEEPEQLPPASVSTQLPVVQLGSSDGETELPESARLLRGRLPASAIFYPVYLLLVLSGGLVANAALDTGEWSFWVTTLGWFLMFGWNWLYVETWQFQRRVLLVLSVASAFGMELGIAAICQDRAEAQLVWSAGELVERAPLPSLQWASWMLIACATGLLLHLIWFGRGFRRARPTADEEVEG